MNRYLTAGALLWLVTLLLLSGKIALAQGETLHAFQCYMETLNFTYSHERLGSIAPNYEVYYSENISAPGSIGISIFSSIFSTQPLELVIKDSITGKEIYRSSASSNLSLTFTANISTPAILEIGIYNPGSYPADYYGYISVELCGSPAVAAWINGNIKATISQLGSIAPVGVVDYGVTSLSGEAFFYSIRTNSVRGIVNITNPPSSISYYANGTAAFPGFSIQLNAFLVVDLADGKRQIYWLQNCLNWKSSYGSMLGYIDNIWNATSTPSQFSQGRIVGNGGTYWYWGGGEQYYAYGKEGTIAFGTHDLTISTALKGSSIIVNFILDGKVYDSVLIEPYAPANRAEIYIDPSIKTSYGTPLDLELVFAGYSAEEPIAVLSGGSIELSLYYNLSGSWIPPLAAWSIGTATYERARANSIAIFPHSAAVLPGNAEAYQLWSSSVIVVTPYGVFMQESNDISQYLKEIDLGNGTRLILPRAYVDGREVNGSTVPMGTVVFINYTREYLVRVSSPLGNSSIWAIDGTPLMNLINTTIYLSQSERMVLISAFIDSNKIDFSSYSISGPINLTLVYGKEYLVDLLTYNGEKNIWIREGRDFLSLIPERIDLGNRTSLVLSSLKFNGTYINPQTFSLSSPGRLEAIYVTEYLVKIISPFNESDVWIEPGENLNLLSSKIIAFNNNTRLVLVGAFLPNGTALDLNFTVNSPVDVLLKYEREFLVNIQLLNGNYTAWLPEGTSLNLSSLASTVHGNSGIYAYSLSFQLLYISTSQGNVLSNATLNNPIEGRGVFRARAAIQTSLLGLPNVLTLSTLTCGSSTNESISFMSREQILTLDDPSVSSCSVSIPISVPLPIAALITIIFGALIAIKMKR
ncbi:MAG: thermopsin family protease [Fervidicoccaceae archaeon]